MLNNSGESGHPCLVHDLRGNAFSFSSMSIVFAVGLSYMAFTLLRKGSFYAHFLNSFHHKWLLNFVQGFFCIYWDYHIVFIFQFVNMMYHIDWFAYIEESLHSWNKPNLIMVYRVAEFYLLKFCWGFSHLCLSVVLACSILILCCLCLVLVSGWPRIMSLEVFLPLQFFERLLEG